jgi:hypothetical protein
MDKAPDNKALSGSDIPFPFESEFGRRLTIGDICHYAPGMLNKIGKEGKTSWDSFAYALMMGHNVECHIIAVQRAQQLMDIEVAKTKGKVNWRLWKKVKSGDMSDEYSDWVPRNILYFSNFIEDLFNTATKAEAFEMIDQAMPFLKTLEGARLQGGPAQNTFGNLFEIETVTNQDEIDLANPDDDELRVLEENITGE